MDYGLIGEKLGHSYSKEIHESIASYSYELKEIPRDALDDFLTRREFKAINVTIPYKESVIPYMAELSEKAREIGAVNTVINRHGKLQGDNTDFDGMRALIKHAGLELGGRKVLILGTGGTSKTALAVAGSLGAGEILKVSRRGQGNGIISYAEAMSVHKDAEIIINTTPLGMYPDTGSLPMDISGFTKLCGLIDAVYNPLRSALVLEAQRRGIKAEGGLYMLAAQAVYACEKFLGYLPAPADELTEKAFKSVLRKKENIVLCGMPSCGKTTVGQALSSKLNLSFIDMDDLIVSRTGMSIADYFKEKGEKAFRDIESEIALELSKKSGLVIATGGGAVLREENVLALKKNGRLFFIDRPLEKLITTDDRPLSSNRELLEKRYNERYDIYRAVCDIRVDGSGSAAEVTEIIMGMR